MVKMEHSMLISILHRLLPILFFVPPFIVIYNLYQYSRLKTFPGPRLASLTDFYRLWDVFWNSHSDRGPTVELHEKYGDVVRYGPNMLLFSDPRAIKDIYNPSGVIEQEFVKSEAYSMGDQWIDGELHTNIFFTRSVPWHAKLKRSFGAAFILPSITAIEHQVDETIRVFLDATERKYISLESGKLAEPGRRLDLMHWMQYFALDVLGQMIYGERHGFLERDQDVDGIIGLAGIVTRYGYWFGQAPWLDQFLLKNPLLVTLSKWGIIKTEFPVVPFAKKHIEQRKKRRAVGTVKSESEAELVGEDLLARMLELRQKDPENLTEFEVVKMCGQFVFAGNDTIASTLTALIYYLLRNEECHKKLKAEIDSFPDASDSSVPSYSAVWNSLPYLQACVNETFRLHPAIGFNLERIVPKGGATIGGHFVPGGTIVAMNAWAAHRRKKTWGEDAEIFCPERWLEASDQQKAEMDRVMLHFGAGAHLCIGRWISLVEIYKLVPCFFKKFEVEFADPEQKWQLNNMGFVKPTNCDVRLRLR